MHEMKDSGVKWIGKIPSSWECYRISMLYSERSTKVSDKDFEPLSVTKQGILTQLDSAAKSDDGDNRKLVLKGDFVINSRSDRRGSCGISDINGSVSLINTVLMPKRNVCNDYYNFAFRTERFADEYFRWGNGIAADLWSTKWSSFKRINIFIPPHPEQQAIADYLDRKCGLIYSTIEKQRSVIEKLKLYKQSVITEAVTKGLDKNAKMKPSGVDWVGDIPEHWQVTKISKLFCFLGGYAFSSELYSEESNNQIIRIGNVKNDVLLLDANPVYTDDINAESANGCQLKENDILFTMTGTKGKRDYFYTLLVKDEDVEDRRLYLNQRVGCFRRLKNDSPRYYNYLLKDSRILDSIFLYESGTANQGNLGIESIRRTRLQMPPITEQVEIADYLDKICAKIDFAISNKQKVIDKLTGYEKSLIYECVTGKREIS